MPKRSCFGPLGGLSGLEQTLFARKESAPPGSYTARLFNDEKLLRAKILEEASELSEAKTPEHIAEEMADVIYFGLTKCVVAGVGWEQFLPSCERAIEPYELEDGVVKYL